MVPDSWTYEPKNTEKLARKIDTVRRLVSQHPFEWFSLFRQTAEEHTWERIRARYVKIWKELLKCEQG